MEREPLYKFYKEWELKDYIEVIIRRKKILLTFLLSLVFIVSVYSYTATPIYQATTQILIERNEPQILNFQEVYAMPSAETEYYQTQYRILKSRSLAEKIVEKLNLTASPRFQGGNPIDALLGMIIIEPVGKSRLVNINVQSDNPQFAATIANTIAEEYVKKDIEDKLFTTKYAVGWLTDEMKKMKEKVEESEKKLQEYKETNELVSLEESQNIVVQKLAELNSKATQAKGKKLETENKYKQVEENRDKPDTLPSVRDNALVQELKQVCATKEGTLSEMMKRYKEKHPKIIQLKSELKTLQERIDTEIGKVVDSIKGEYEEAEANERTALLALTEQEKKALELNRMAIEYNVLKRDTETNREMYEALLKRMKETDISGGLQASNIRVIDKAEVPKGPIKPRKSTNIIMAIFIGILSGAAAAFTLEYLDDSIRNQRDIEAYIQLPFLGHVPIVRTKGATVGLYANLYPRSEVSESLRSVKTNINFTLTTPPPHALLLTSVAPQEGKTSLSSNLSIVMAQGGDRVLLVDADMRHPTVHKIFKTENSKGLRDYLSGAADFDSVVQKSMVENLSIVASGRVPPNPVELLDSPRTKLFLKEAKAKFDRIIIDSPPIIAVSDALILAKLVDGVVYIVRGSKTSREAAFEGKRRLLDIDAKILGIALNYIDIRKERYYYYGYYYGGQGKRRKTEEDEVGKIGSQTAVSESEGEAVKAEELTQSKQLTDVEKIAKAEPSVENKSKRPAFLRKLKRKPQSLS